MADHDGASDVVDTLNLAALSLNDTSKHENAPNRNHLAKYSILTATSPISESDLSRRIRSVIPAPCFKWAFPRLDIQRTREGYLLAFKPNNEKVQVLEACEWAWNRKDYRVLIDGKHVVYVEAHLSAITLIHDDLLVMHLLPSFPIDRGNYCVVDQVLQNGRAKITGHFKRSLLSIHNLWRPERYSHLEFDIKHKWAHCTYFATHPVLGPVMLRCGGFEGDVWTLRKEGDMYQRIEGHGLAPKFLGYVTEEQRVIGFVLEDCSRGTREVGSGDYQAWKHLLKRLAALGILVDRPQAWMFVVREGRALLTEFSTARVSSERYHRGNELLVDGILRDMGLLAISE